MTCRPARIVLLGLLLSSAAAAYEPAPAVAGAVRLVGSDTLAALVTAWTDAFRELHPAAVVEVQAAGSSSAPPALVEATAEIGAMSRRLTGPEFEAIAAARGRPPLELLVARDAVAVIVHRANPLAELSLTELDAAFSSTRLCGASARVSRWRDLGVTGSLGGRPVDTVGRNAVSGTYAFFRRVALCSGRFDAHMDELPGSGAVLAHVARTPAAIGYVGSSYVTPEVRTLAVRPEAGAAAIAPTRAATASGRYPLSRPLYLYVGRAAGASIAPIAREFVRFALSGEGRAITASLGFVPPDPPAVRAALARLAAGGEP